MGKTKAFPSAPGCDPSNKQRCLRAHPESCAFRKVECPARKCLDLVAVSALCRHLRKKHAETTVFTRIDR